MFAGKTITVFIAIATVFIALILPARSQTVDPDSSSLPNSVKAHYSGHKTAFWEVLQVSNSGLFDEPESSLAKFYVEKPDRMLIITADREIFVHCDTVWIYVQSHKQIQRSTGQYAVNPLDFIDGNSKNFKIKRLSENRVMLTANDESFAPNKIEVTYDSDGRLRRAEYMDPNDQLIRLEFRKESFRKKIPAQAFYKKIKSGIQIIDLDKE